MQSQRLIACVDGSAYAGAVCDYAAWLGGPMEAPIALLHAVDPAGRRGRKGRSVLGTAAQRLRDHGVEPAELTLAEGPFPQIALDFARQSSGLVLGKRGEGGADDRRVQGSNIDPVLREAKVPVLLASLLFLPVTRALVLLDSEPDHRRTVEFVQAQPWLSGLELDLIVMTDGKGGQHKLEWARRCLRARGAGVFPLTVAGPHEALAQYGRNHAVDLLILSREIALSGRAEPLREIATDSLWAWRAPVLVC